MDQQLTPPTVADYVDAIRHRPWLVALSTVALAGLAFVGLGRGGPVYESSAEVLLRSTEAQQAFDTTNAATNRNLLANEVRFADGDVLRGLVIERLDLGIEPEDLKVDVKAADGADLLIFESIASSAEKSADLANTYAELYVEERRRRAVDSYTGAIATLDQQISDSRDQRQSLAAELTALRVDIAGEPEGSSRRLRLEQDLAQREAELSPTLVAIEAEEAELLNALSTLRVSSELAKTGTAEIISEAFPGDPNSSRRYPSIFIGGLLGLIAGAVAAVSLERLSDTVRSADDLARRFPNIAMLGSLPTSTMAPKALGPQTRSRPTAPFAEAILQIRASIRFMANEDEIEMITVTSPNAGEGKTTLSTSLAWAMANLSDRVVLVDADLRRPSVHEHFPVENEAGTTEYLRGAKTLLQCAIRFSEQPDHFALLTSGGRVDNPADLMANPETLQLLRLLTVQGRVVVDGAPILPVSDSRSLSSASDLTILVVRVGSTKLSEVDEALKRIRLTGGTRVAFVVNGVAADSTPYVSSRRFWHGRESEALPTLRALLSSTTQERPLEATASAAPKERRGTDAGRSLIRRRTRGDQSGSDTLDRRSSEALDPIPPSHRSRTGEDVAGKQARRPLFASDDAQRDAEGERNDESTEQRATDSSLQTIDDDEADDRGDTDNSAVGDDRDEQDEEADDQGPDGREAHDEEAHDEEAHDEEAHDEGEEDGAGDDTADDVFYQDDNRDVGGDDPADDDNNDDETEQKPAPRTSERRETSRTRGRSTRTRTVDKRTVDNKTADERTDSATPVDEGRSTTSGRKQNGSKNEKSGAAAPPKRQAKRGRSARPRLPRNQD